MKSAPVTMSAVKRPCAGHTRELPRGPVKVELKTWKKKGSDKRVKSEVAKNFVGGGKVFLILFFEKQSL